jgi:hypothetical protein
MVELERLLELLPRRLATKINETSEYRLVV